MGDKLLVISRRLAVPPGGRRLVTTANGAPCCCGGGQPPLACALGVCPPPANCESWGCATGPMHLRARNCPCAGAGCDYTLTARFTLRGTCRFVTWAGAENSGAFDIVRDFAGSIDGRPEQLVFNAQPILVNNIIPPANGISVYAQLWFSVALQAGAVERFNPPAQYTYTGSGLGTLIPASPTQIRTQLVQAFATFNPSGIARSGWLRWGYSWQDDIGGGGFGSGGAQGSNPTGAFGGVTPGHVVNGKPFSFATSGNYRANVGGDITELAIAEAALDFCPSTDSGGCAGCGKDGGL